jgi:metallophosphoesterase superfamily enzyme
MGDGNADGGVHYAEGDLPQQEWALASEHPAFRVRNRFSAEEVARCIVTWSFRDADGLNIDMSLVSPEVELAPGQQVTLTSDYDLSNFRFA